jgi:hypothetical protein
VQDPMALIEAPLNEISWLPATALGVVLQVLVKPLGLATIRPVGSISLNPTPVSVIAVFGLVIVKLTVVEPPGTIFFGEKLLLIVGGNATEICALAPLPVRDSLELTPLVVFVKTPGTLAVTVTLIAQVAIIAIVPPERLTEFPEAVSVPPQVLVAVPETVIPVGSVSVKLTPVIASVFAFPRVKDSVVVVPTGITDGLKDFIIVGSTVAEAGKQGLLIAVRGLYWDACPKSFVVAPEMSFPKLNTQLFPVPAWLKNG